MKEKDMGSMLLCLIDEKAANTLLSKGLLDVAGESCIVEEWEIQKVADQRCFKCQKFGHLATQCGGPTVCGNCAENGHTHRECLNLQSSYANYQGKHRANDRGCPAKPGSYLHSNLKPANKTSSLPQLELNHNPFIRSSFSFNPHTVKGVSTSGITTSLSSSNE